MATQGVRATPFEERFHEYARSLDCIHCGLCIPFCPTHGITGRESDSPRGRIYLMRGFAEETLSFSPESERHIEQCIVCRACETVCPSGIRMGDMMESFRQELDRRRTSRPISYRMGRFLLRSVLPRRRLIAALSDVLWLYQTTRLDRLIGAIGSRLSRRFASLDALQPRIPPPRARRIATDRKRPEGYPAEGPRRVRVALFLGCIASEWFAPVHRATIRVLRKNGCDVVIPDAQTCCGALHRHAGFLDDAHALYKANAAVFRNAGVDAVVVNAAGCGAALKEAPAELPDGLGPPVRDVCEFLDEIGLIKPTRLVERRVVYDQPCHLLHGQGIGSHVVERLLRQVPGVRLLPLPDSDRCCGSGGVYNLLHPELAEPIRDEKIREIVATGCDTVVTGNPGCAMQIASGLSGTSIEVLHPVEVLAAGYGEEGDPEE